MQEKFWRNIRWQKVLCAEKVKRLLQNLWHIMKAVVQLS